MQSEMKYFSYNLCIFDRAQLVRIDNSENHKNYDGFLFGRRFSICIKRGINHTHDDL